MNNVTLKKAATGVFPIAALIFFGRICAAALEQIDVVGEDQYLSWRGGVTWQFPPGDERGMILQFDKGFSSGEWLGVLETMGPQQSEVHRYLTVRSTGSATGEWFAIDRNGTVGPMYESFTIGKERGR